VGLHVVSEAKVTDKKQTHTHKTKTQYKTHKTLNARKPTLITMGSKPIALISVKQVKNETSGLQLHLPMKSS
jgi:hypothetical protein